MSVANGWFVATFGASDKNADSDALHNVKNIIVFGAVGTGFFFLGVSM